MSATKHIVKGIDHLIVMVRDLDLSERKWRSLGFQTTARGFHATGGTANHLITLDGTYIELLGLADPAAASPSRALIEEGAGLAGIAFRGSADETFGLWRDRRLAVVPPADLARGIDIDGNRHEARFRITMLDRSVKLPFLMFCCEHLTPELVWRPGLGAHANGATRLEELIVLVDDAETQAYFERVSGRTSLSFDDSHITLLSEQAFRLRFGAHVSLEPRARPRLAGLGLSSNRLDAARRLAGSAGWSTLHDDATRFAAQDPDDGLVIEWSA